MIYHSIYKIGGLCLNMKYSHDTRDTNKIYNYKVKHAFAHKCFKHSLSLLLNNLPEIVKEKPISHSTQVFAKYVKLYFLLFCWNATLRIKNHLSTLCYMYTYLYLYLRTSIFT